MYKYEEIKKLHLEVSSLCQAKCPMCARNEHGGLPNPNVIEKNLDIKKFKSIIPSELIAQVTGISLCGNYGDPILNKDLIKIVDYIAKSNPNVDLQVHTNGSARSKSWWKDLAKAMPKNHIVLFGIDGLEDTHHLYRIGTDFNKIIENAKSFIAAGGIARWNFITFKHNEHQLETARQLAKELGFDSFHEKQTSRFIGDPFFEVLDSNGNVAYKLESPSEKKIAFIDRKTVENYKEAIASCTVSCEVEGTKSLYIDSQGYAWPCCFLASVPYQYSRPNKLVWDFMTHSKESLNSALEAFGGMEGLNLNKRSVKDLVNSDAWQTVWNKGFEDKSVIMCARVCGKFEKVEVSQCRDQFLDLDVF
jgi:MoaA/NifB/PqqE/SkfB family radical SAM enzyme